MGLSRKKHNRNFPRRTKAQGGRLVTLTLDFGLRHLKGKEVELLLEISQAIPWDQVKTKHNRNFPDRTKAQGGRPVTLTLDLGLRHFKGKAVELLLEISLAIPWD